MKYKLKLHGCTFKYKDNIDIGEIYNSYILDLNTLPDIIELESAPFNDNWLYASDKLILNDTNCTDYEVVAFTNEVITWEYDSIMNNWSIVK